MLWQLFVSFTKIGAFTIGGGYAMLPVIEREVAQRRGWVTSEDFWDMAVIAQSAPGLLAMNISILTGNKIAGRRGAVVSALGAALPSFIIILLIALFFTQFQTNIYVMRIFRALRPAVVALILLPVVKLWKQAKIGWRSAWIPVVVAALIGFFAVSPVLIIIVSILTGIVLQVVALQRAKKEEEGQK